MFRFIAKSSAYILVILLAGLWLKPHASTAQLPLDKLYSENVLKIRSVDESSILIEDVEYGGVQFSFETEMKNVSPAMLHWFNANQKAETIRIRKESLPWFKLVHPAAQIDLKIVASPDDRTNKIMFGTVYDEFVNVNNTVWLTRNRVGSFGDEGMRLDLMYAGYKVGELNFTYTQQGSGTLISLNGSLGLTVPVIGHISNFYLMNKIYPRALIQDWLITLLESYRYKETLIPMLFEQQNNDSYQLAGR